MPTSYPFSIMLTPETAGPFVRQFVMDAAGQPGDDWVDCLQEVIEPTLRDFVRQMVFDDGMPTIPSDEEADLPFVDAWNAIAAAETCNDPESERHLDTVMDLLAQPPNGLTAQLMGRGEGMTERAAGEFMIKHLEAGCFSVYEATLPSESGTPSSSMAGCRALSSSAARPRSGQSCPKKACRRYMPKSIFPLVIF